MSKTMNKTEITLALATEVDVLSDARVHWENGSLKSSNTELYQLLQSCVDFYLDIRSQPEKCKALDIWLSTNNIQCNMGTGLRTRIVRAVFGADCGRRAYTYTRVITVAADEKSPEMSMSDFVTGRGGIEEVRRITVDYTKPPNEVFDTYFNFMMPDPETLIVGTSLGGFFAAWLGVETEYPFIAINPAINPVVTLRKYEGNGTTHFGSPFTLKPEVIEAYTQLPFRMDGTGEVVLDEGDEVLCASETSEYVGSKLPVTTFKDGSHRFDHMDQLAATIRHRLSIGSC